MIKAYAQSHSGLGKASANATADDAAYTAKAMAAAAEAGYKNPARYVNQNLKSNKTYSRNRVMGQANRKG